MKNYIKHTIAILLLIVFVISSYLPVVAAGQPSSYSTTSNSGQRGVVCTTLDGTSADDYYTGNYTYDNLVSLSKAALLINLRTLLKTTHTRTTSYTECKSLATKTDCENNNGRVLLLYTSYSTSGGNWNREHVWPRSLGGYETTGPGADLHHIRPTDNQVNSDRSNLRYGNVDGGVKSIGGNAANGVLGGYMGGFFEPLDNVKGDVARICLYMYVRYGAEYTKCANVTNVFQSVDVLLEWCALDPVDTWEMGRNEVIAAYQGNRNVFIDYPELAWALFDKVPPSDMTTPSGNAAKGNVGSGGSGSVNQVDSIDTVIAYLDKDAEKILILLTLGASNSMALHGLEN